MSSGWDRDTSIPLHVWIRNKGGILNLGADSVFQRCPSGCSIANRVAYRFFSMYPTPAYRAMDIVHAIAVRYRTNARYMTKDLYYLSEGIGLVSVIHNEYGEPEIKATFSTEARRHRDKKLSAIRRLPTGDALDILVATLELEGVFKYEMPIKRIEKIEKEREAKREKKLEKFIEDARLRQIQNYQSKSNAAKLVWAKRKQQQQLNGELR